MVSCTAACCSSHSHGIRASTNMFQIWVGASEASQRCGSLASTCAKMTFLRGLTTTHRPTLTSCVVAQNMHQVRVRRNTYNVRPMKAASVYAQHHLGRGSWHAMHVTCNACHMWCCMIDAPHPRTLGIAAAAVRTVTEEATGNTSNTCVCLTRNTC